MFVVGIGSAMFHGTLQWEWQLVDELPMLLTTLLILLGLSSTHPALPTLVRTSIRFGAIAFTLLATFAYVTSRAYATFQRAFTGLCVAVVVLIGSHLYISKFPPLPTTLALRSLLLFALGLALWHVDRFLCPDLHRARTLLGPALGTVTQMHAWWHVLSGYATYTVITLVTYFKQAQAQTGTGGISGGKEVGPRLRIEGGWVPRIVMGSVDDEGAREKGASSVGEDTPLLSSSALEKSPLASPPPPASQAPASPPVPAVSSDPARAAKKHQDDQEQEQEAIFGTAKFPKTIGRKAGKAMARGFVDM
ncbi:hypothetical protein M427DRAFT_276702 [Gonapodya prolifera JEL478]|uniref:Ceramidase n=1 Tax=Gonapodya prolifera (strain JEL478) TaxID=1344416 RepID=A0A139AYB6_GONPJ|nr:hypothetical protein M427DRAFT_276702 [Gonapodya prolifera JEL478]|eukprot:KXS21697.1 hypothetical protein M427DRAFT_276702 [Gonapodya prolifera JEL478]